MSSTRSCAHKPPQAPLRPQIWEQRPLTADLLAYAACDVRYLHALADALNKKLPKVIVKMVGGGVPPCHCCRCSLSQRSTQRKAQQRASCMGREPPRHHPIHEHTAQGPAACIAYGQGAAPPPSHT